MKVETDKKGKVIIPKGYRRLRSGIILKDGDRFPSTFPKGGVWFLTVLGGTFRVGLNYRIYIRKNKS